MAETAIFIAHGTEECEALIVVDLFRRAGIEITMVSTEETREIVSSHKVTIQCDQQIDDYEVTDEKLLIIPGGGKGVARLKGNAKVSQILTDFRQAKGNLAAICAGPSVLGRLNLLDGQSATVYPGWEDQLGQGVDYKAERVVEDDWLVTGQALGSSIPFTLKLIERLRDKATSDKIAAEIYYPRE